jgi:hypothetical protein
MKYAKNVDIKLKVNFFETSVFYGGKFSVEFPCIVGLSHEA